uniref:Ig-like domain-containing protein n=1 Tax=Monopterus albus TaxID=43700 RepID=A0A3Q3KRU0_MONAL
MFIANFLKYLLYIFSTGARCEVIEVFAEAGSQAVLPCKSNTLFPTPSTIVWSKDNEGTVWRKQKSGLQYWGSNWVKKGIQRVQCPHYQFERGDYSLQINDLKENDGGVYSCRVTLGNIVSENVVRLRIIKVSVSQSFPIWGSDVSVTCDVTPWPYGASVQWMLNNNLFVSRSIISNRNTPKSTVREKATARLTGNWTCVVGFKGKEGRASAVLSVQGFIQPSTDNTKVYVAVGSAVTLPCVFSPGLTPSSPGWEKLKPGSLFKPIPGHLPLSFSQSLSSSQHSWDRSASLKEVGFEDEGRYRCSGTLQGQRLTRNMQLVVAKINSNISKKKGSVTLTCQLSDTTEVTDYEWVQVTYDVNGTQSVGSSHKGKTLSISSMSEEKRSEWTCRFYGKGGILGNITYHVPLMSGLSGQKQTNSSHNTAAVIGLSFLLVILLLILAQMYKNHQRRKKAFQYPAMETIVHNISNEREERAKRQVKK